MKGTGHWLLKKAGCRRFIREAEDFLATHPGAAGGAPVRLAPHLGICRLCTRRWQVMLASHSLLHRLQAEKEPAADPYFYERLRARIQTLQPRYRRAEIRWLHLALAAALFVAALGSFAYNLQRTEMPNADEAMALDVPHINPQHPADSHVQPRLADAMLNLMNP
ncbi:MAG: hypothetical protein EPN33_09070 [Acidobacteria bacterium]|nr:MAG: hypothetical protein EPN33_09070 [Acidobacteriota bacterium]